MSRKRMLDPAIWTDEGFLEMSMTARIIFIGLISNADDAGRGYAGAKAIKAKILPGDDITVAEIDKAKGEITAHSHTRFYSVDGTEYYQLERWLDYQNINRAFPSKIPGPMDSPIPTPITDQSLNNHPPITDQSLPIQNNTIQINTRERERAREDTAEYTTPGVQEYEAANDEPEGLRPSPSWMTIPVPGVKPSALPEPDQLLIAWYAVFNKRMGTLARGSPRDREHATEAIRTVGSLDAALSAIPKYFDHWRDYWFATNKADAKKAPGAKRPDFQFGSFASHIAQIVADAKPREEVDLDVF